MSFAIYTDSCSNLPGTLIHNLNIRVMPFSYFIDGQPVTYDGDIEKFAYTKFYGLLRAGKMVTTSLTSIQSYMDHFRKALEQGLDVVYVGLSSGVSGTFQSARAAAAELQKEFSDRVIRVVDSLGAGLGTGLLTCMGADLRNEGLTAKTVADRLDEAKMRLCEFFTVDDLMFLGRSGRISQAAAKLGSLLHIKPLLRGDEEGHIVPCGKYRGRKKAVDAIVERYRQKMVDPEHSRVAISHGDCLEEAEELAERVCQIAKPKELIICPHEPATGSHVGPGMLALFFFGDNRD